MKNRSAISGKAVTSEFAKSNPATTVRVGKSKDTKRLDWLAKNRADVVFAQGSVFVGRGMGANKKLRAAIDEAMKR